MTGDTPSWGRPGSRVYEYVFVASAPLAAFVSLGFLIERLIEVTLPSVLHLSKNQVMLGLIAVLYLSLWATVRVVRGRWPAFLGTPLGYSAAEAVLPLGGWCVGAYVASACVLGACTFVLVPKTDPHWPLIVYGFTVWLPLFFAVPMGSMMAWLRVVRADRNHERAR